MIISKVSNQVEGVLLISSINLFLKSKNRFFQLIYKLKIFTIMKHIKRFNENADNQQNTELKKGELYMCSMPMNNDGKFRIYVKVKFLGKSDDGSIVISPVEEVRFQVEGKTNFFKKDNNYNSDIKNMLNVDFSPIK